MRGINWLKRAVIYAVFAVVVRGINAHKKYH